MVGICNKGPSHQQAEAGYGYLGPHERAWRHIDGNTQNRKKHDPPSSTNSRGWEGKLDERSGGARGGR
eukprot:scaffold283470_cov32-Tisochrysis_lutea.AAC.1